MKVLKISVITFLTMVISEYACSQNILINVLTKNAGVLQVGDSGFLEISICNTSSLIPLMAYKIKPQVSFPVSLVNISDTGHILPSGWSILSNSGGILRLSNGSDQVPPNSCRTVLIAFKGISQGGPSTISGNILFSNGEFPGSVSGPATYGDNTADNTSSTTCKVVN